MRRYHNMLKLFKSCLHFFVFLIFVFMTEYGFAQKKLDVGTQLELDIDRDQVVSVFNKAGHDYESCQQDEGCEGVGWPNKQAKVFYISEASNQGIRYYNVKFEYKDKKGILKKGHGWILAEQAKPKNVQLSTKAKLKPSVKKTTKEPEVKKTESIPNQNCNSCHNSVIDQLQKAASEIYDSAADLFETEEMKTDEMVEVLKPYIGQCSTWPVDQVPKKIKSSSPVYDQTALWKLNQTLQEKGTPSINGKKLTKTQLIEIDALSRTIYAEMGLCTFHGKKTFYSRNKRGQTVSKTKVTGGPQYPKAVARIALNRGEKEQFWGNHNSLKGPISKAVTTDSQFSVWNHGSENLTHSLCPPISEDAKFYTNRKPNEYEVSIWNKALKIATQTVLKTEEFKDLTSEVTGTDYTSNLVRPGRKQLKKIRIDGRAIDSDECMILWAPEKK